MNLDIIKLIETANSQKGVYARNENTSGYHIDKDNSDLFISIVEDIEVFVFASKQEYPTEIPEQDEDFIDAPFRNFSFEVLGKAITVSHSDEPECNIECVVVHEKKPKQFIFFILYKITGRYVVFAEELSENNTVSVSINNLVILYTQRITREASGTEKTGLRVKLRYGNEKKLIKLKRIIHIAPKSQKERYALNNLRQIDWHSRWTQRGHWRDIGDKVGKDRNGAYCIKGKTWVVECVKGPEDKPLIRKTRIVNIDNEAKS